jgi:hypothetical protein
LNGWSPNTTSTVINILGITFEDYDTNHVDDSNNNKDNDNDNDKDRFDGLFESVDNIPNNEFKTSAELSDQLFDLSASRVSPISNTTLCNVFGHIVSFYDKSQYDVKYLIGGMATKMKEIVCGGIKATNSMNIDLTQS